MQTELKTETRHNMRATVNLSAIYVGKDLVGQACVCDLSTTSLYLLGTAPVRTGTTLATRVYSLQDGTFLHIPTARVTWTRGYEFELQFERLPERERSRLLIWLMDLVHSPYAISREADLKGSPTTTDTLA